MPYVWNPLTDRWQEYDPRRKLTDQDHACRERRGELIDALIDELNKAGRGAIGLYTGLLARELISSDEVLIKQYGKRFKHALKEEPHRVA